MKITITIGESPQQSPTEMLARIQIAEEGAPANGVEQVRRTIIVTYLREALGAVSTEIAEVAKKCGAEFKNNVASADPETRAAMQPPPRGFSPERN